MGPYLAIIYDCFSEAFKSRILWVLLIGWTVLLGALAPFGWIEGDDFQIRSESITNRDRLLKELQAVSRGQGSNAQKRVWEALDSEFRTRIEKSAAPEGATINLGRMAEGMSSALDAPDLYEKEAWPTAAARSELTKDLEDYQPGSLKGESLTRVNRRLIELAFPTGLRNTTQSAVWIGYAGIKLFNPIPVNREQLRPFIDGLILLGFLKLALGVVGILVAIVVTSNLIPDMFTPGSMALLLSKPISRSGLLLSKYFGGVCFILINVTYLLVGFYFLLGWRLQIWNPGLFWCIPIFMFVFMIFYSVSALVGLVWKNAIVSIACVALFWGVCFVLGLTHEQLRAVTVELPQITKLSSIDGHLYGSNQNGQLLIWASEEHEWKSVGGSSGQDRRVLGPYWLPSEKMVVFGKPNWNPFFGFQSDGVRLQSINLTKEEVSDGPDEDLAKQPLWSERRVDSLADLPSASRRVKVIDEKLIVVSENGIFRFDAEIAKQKADNSKQQDDSAPLFGLFKLPNLDSRAVNIKLTEEDVLFEAPIDFCKVPGRPELLVLSKSTLYLFKHEDGGEKLGSVKSMDLELPEDSLALLVADTNTCLIFTNKKHAVRVDLQNWSKHEDLSPTLSELTPQELFPLSDGKFVMLSDEGKVLLIENEGKSFTYPPQSERIRAMTVGENGDLYYCTLGNEVQKLPMGQSQLALVSKPRWTTAQWVYWTFVRPVYAICPKPSAVDSLLHWALASKDPLNFGRQTEDLKQNLDVDVWTPIWSNALFITVVLVLGCIYLSRQDT